MKINPLVVAAWLTLGALQVSAGPKDPKSKQSADATQSDGPKKDGKALGGDGKKIGKSAADLGKNIGKTAQAGTSGVGSGKTDNEATKQAGKSVGQAGEEVGKTTAGIGVDTAKTAVSGTKKGFGKAFGAFGKAGDKLKHKPNDNS